MAYDGCFERSIPPDTKGGRFFCRGTDDQDVCVKRWLSDVCPELDSSRNWVYFARDLTQGPFPVKISRHASREEAREVARKFACRVSRQAWENRVADAERDAQILAEIEAKRARALSASSAEGHENVLVRRPA